MFEYRPPWAAAMTIVGDRSNKIHLRAGWSAGLGFRPWCRRNKSEKAEIASAIESHWVSEDDIQDRELQGNGRSTCEGCCLAWLRAREDN